MDSLVRDVSAALRKGFTPRLSGLNVYQHLMLLRAMIDAEDIALCKSYVSTAELPLGRFKSFDLLVAMLRAAPESREGDAGDLGRRDDEAGFVALPSPGSKQALFVFTGMARQFGCPLPVVHQWFRSLGVSLVYLFDLRETYYLDGVQGLDVSLDGTIERIREIARGMGASSVSCAGNSGGGFGALLYGPLLDAHRTLAFSPPTVIRESLASVCEKAPEVRKLVAEDGTIGIARMHREAARHFESRVYFPAENLHDVSEASMLEGMAGVDLRPVPGARDHNLIPHFVVRGAFMRELLWLTAA